MNIIWELLITTNFIKLSMTTFRSGLNITIKYYQKEKGRKLNTVYPTCSLPVPFLKRKEACLCKGNIFRDCGCGL